MTRVANSLAWIGPPRRKLATLSRSEQAGGGATPSGCSFLWTFGGVIIIPIQMAVPGEGVPHFQMYPCRVLQDHYCLRAQCNGRHVKAVKRVTPPRSLGRTFWPNLHILPPYNNFTIVQGKWCNNNDGFWKLGFPKHWLPRFPMKNDTNLLCYARPSSRCGLRKKVRICAMMISTAWWLWICEDCYLLLPGTFP